MSRKTRRILLLVALPLIGVGIALAVNHYRPIRQRDWPPNGPLITEEMAKSIDATIVTFVNRSFEAARQDPTSAKACAELAMACHANGLAEHAETTYRQAIALERDTDRRAVLWYQLAMIQADGGDSETALKSLDESIALNPSHEPSHWQRGFWSLERGSIDDAEAAFANALRMNPQSDAARVGMARVHLQSGESKEAERILEELLKATGPIRNEPYVRQLLGTARRNLGRSEEATPDLFVAGGLPAGVGASWPQPWLDPVAAMQVGFRALLQRANALLSMSQPQEAVHVIEEALRERPNDATALNYLGMARLAMNQQDQCIAALHQALEVDPNLALTHINLSKVYERSDLGKSVFHAEQATRLNPNSGSIYQQLGRVLLLANRPADAVDALHRAVRFGSFDWETRLMLGRALMDAKQPAEAERVLRQALETAPNAAVLYLAMARALAEQGRFESADQSLDRARELNPNEPLLPFVTERVRQLKAAAPTGGQ